MCSAVACPPTPPPPRTPQRAPHSHAYIKTYHAGPCAFTRRHMPSTQVSLLYTPGAICTLPPSPPPTYLYTSKVYRAFFPFNLPPSKRERDVQQVQVKGGGGVLRLIQVEHVPSEYQRMDQQSTIHRIHVSQNT